MGLAVWLGIMVVVKVLKRTTVLILSLPGAFSLLTDLVALLSQETLDSACQDITCFAKFAEREKIAKIRAEINEVQPLLLSAYS